MNKGNSVILLRESVLGSVARDAATFVMVVGIIGVGWFLGSSAMQWAGFAMCCLLLIGLLDKNKASIEMTPQEASDFLAREYSVTPKSTREGSA